MISKNINILECTLRDGSYVIDFQFTVRDTAIIGAALENAGFDMIEIGHGVGLNASNAGHGVAAATDEEYMKVAEQTFRTAKWGMFFIPGIGRHDDLEMAAYYGMDFVRIGTNANEVEQSKEYIKHAKKLGMFVSSNLMKSYALPPKELALKGKLCQEYGTDLVCLVDSAGTMMPDDIRDYMQVMRDKLSIPLGLHCHDNLALGIGNALAAVDCGAVMIDSTLQGMGRGGGNPVTEVLVTVLKKRGIDLGIKTHRVMDISDRIIKPLLKNKGWDGINITSGYAGFHSSYLKTIMRYANQYRVDPRDLIVGVCEADQVYAPEELVERTAQQLRSSEGGQARVKFIPMPRFVFPSKGKQLTGDFTTAVRNITREARTTAVKKGKLSVLNIVGALQALGKATVSPFIQEEFRFVICSLEVDNEAQLKEAVGIADGIIDILMIDSERKAYLGRSFSEGAKEQAKKSRVIAYKDSHVWLRSVEQQIDALLDGLHGKRITIYGSDHLAMKLMLSLMEQGAEVVATAGPGVELKKIIQGLKNIASGDYPVKAVADPISAVNGAHILVRFEKQEPLMDEKIIEAVSRDAIIFDAGIGTLSKEAIIAAHKKNVLIIRPDMRAALAAELASLLDVQKTVNQIMGRVEMNGTFLVAGGVVGRYGDVVVDSVSKPTKVVGIADGAGKVIYNRKPEFEDLLARVETEIIKRQIT